MSGLFHGRKLSLSSRVIGTLICLILFRFTANLLLPFIDVDKVSLLFGSNASFGMLNVLTGGNLSKMSLAALGIAPYISASILIQIVGVLIPKFGELQKQGSIGQDRIKTLTFAVSVVIAMFQALGMISTYKAAGLMLRTDMTALFTAWLCMVAGSIFTVSLGILIEKRFFGNGISLILVVGILSNMPGEFANAVNTLSSNFGAISVGVFAVLVIVLIGFVHWLYACEIRLPVTYSAKRNVIASDGRTEHIPFKVLGNSVLPVIFASAFLAIPSMVQLFFNSSSKFWYIFESDKWFDGAYPWASIGLVVYFLLIWGFSVYYQKINMNEVEIADNLKRADCVIHNVNPGSDTVIFLRRHLKKLNFFGSVGLFVLAVVPIILGRVLNVTSIGFLGTSLVILVAVIEELYYSYKVERIGARCQRVTRELADGIDVMADILLDKRGF